LKIQPIIGTLALLSAGRGIAQVISNGGQLDSVSMPSFEFWVKEFALFACCLWPILVMALIVAAGPMFRACERRFRAARHRRAAAHENARRGFRKLGQPHENIGLPP
jgi:ribose/xylose/arabinose/galactoside ABC-type transport system permease subunit